MPLFECTILEQVNEDFTGTEITKPDQEISLWSFHLEYIQRETNDRKNAPQINKSLDKPRSKGL